MMYLNDEEQRGYDARRHPEPFGPNYFDGGYDYQRGWDLAVAEERREREHREELRQQEAEEERIFQQRMEEEVEILQQQDLMQEIIAQEINNAHNQRQISEVLPGSQPDAAALGRLPEENRPA